MTRVPRRSGGWAKGWPDAAPSISGSRRRRKTTVTFRFDVETPDPSKSIKQAMFDHGDVQETAFLSPESKGSNDKENNHNCAN